MKNTVITTAQQMTAQQIKEQQIKEQQITEFTTMISHIAHAINNPLTVISTRSQMLKQSLDMQKPVTNENLAQYFDKINQQSDRIKQIVEAMRMLTSHTPSDQYVDCNINSVVEEAYSLVLPSLKENGIEFIFNKNVSAKLIHGKFNELVQVFVNLFNNAKEAVANTPSPRIELNYEEDASHIHLYFNDNGPGVDKGTENKIFDPFFTSRAAGSTRGLGLSMARKIAKQHSGDVTFEPSRGQSCFRVSLVKKLI